MNTARRFFCLEGIDGSGKTTQMEFLVAALKDRGYEVLALREPGGSAISEKIRALLLDPAYKGTMSSRAELLLYNAARAQVIDEIIRPALASGKIVLADRFAWSTLAYQGYGRKLNVREVEELSALTCGDCVPELTIVFDIPVKESRARMAGEGRTPDRLESEKEEFFERVRSGYKSIAETHSDCVALLDARESRDELRDKVLNLICDRLK